MTEPSENPFAGLAVPDLEAAQAKDDATEIARLAALSPLDRDREFHKAAKAMGVTVGVLRAAVAKWLA